MSTIQPKTFFSATDLRNIRSAVDGSGADLFKSAKEAAPSDGMQDVLILAPTGGELFRSAEAADTTVLAQSLKDQGVSVQENIEDVGVSARVSPERAEELKELGYQVFDNSVRQMQPGLPQIARKGDWSMPKIDAVAMTKSDKLHEAGITGKGQVVAVLDSGFDFPAYNDKLLYWKDVVNGSPEPHDGSGHGTHVVGDVLKTAPDAGIVAIKVMGDDGSGRPSDIIRGLQEVARLKRSGAADIEIVNMSLGGAPDGIPDTLDPINRAVENLNRMGITVVAAAGNSGPDGHTIGSPADSPSALAVGAALNERTVSDFSSRGPTDDGRVRPDVTAPGEFITSWGVPYSEMYQTAAVVERLRGMSGEELKELLNEKPQLREGLGLPEDVGTWPADAVEEAVKPNLPPVFLTPDGQVAAPGTSFASPITAGIAAQLEQVKDVTPEELRSVLRNTADNMGDYTQLEQGQGFVNAEKAARALAG